MSCGRLPPARCLQATHPPEACDGAGAHVEHLAREVVDVRPAGHRALYAAVR